MQFDANATKLILKLNFRFCRNLVLVLELKDYTEKAVYVGDTAGDEQSARDAGIPFIFCAYGFGQAKSPDAIINSFEELKDILL